MPCPARASAASARRTPVDIDGCLLSAQDLRQQVVVRQDSSGIGGEEDQQAVFALGEVQRFFGAFHKAMDAVDFNVAKADPGFEDLFSALRVQQQDADSCRILL